jgi:hypothetical protein
MDKQTLRNYALVGARSRLDALRAEQQQLVALFPELRGQGPGGSPVNRAKVDGEAPVRRRRRRKMTAAQRKAVGERMRKYWAARRKKG